MVYRLRPLVKPCACMGFGRCLDFESGRLLVGSRLPDKPLDRPGPEFSLDDRPNFSSSLVESEAQTERLLEEGRDANEGSASEIDRTCEVATAQSSSGFGGSTLAALCRDARDCAEDGNPRICRTEAGYNNAQGSLHRAFRQLAADAYLELPRRVIEVQKCIVARSIGGIHHDISAVSDTNNIRGCNRSADGLIIRVDSSCAHERIYDQADQARRGERLTSRHHSRGVNDGIR